jgi:glutamine synthetase
MNGKPNSRAHPIATILDELQKSQHQKVKIAFTDINGTLKTLYLNKENFIDASESNFKFQNLLGTSPLGFSALTRVDIHTFRTIPWESHLPFFIGDFEADRKSLNCFCPRQILKKVLERFQSLNYSLISGIELEWFNFTTSKSPVESTEYSILRSELHPHYLKTIQESLEAFNVPIEVFDSHTGPGVLKASIQCADALEAADRAILLKTTIKAVANHFGIIPTFMAKWNSQLPGCSGRIHQSLWSTSEERNLFYDEDDSFRMSSTFKSYLAGQLTCLPELLPLFAPTVNSYKRLAEDYSAPSQVNWGVESRTAAFRVLPLNSHRTRLEARMTGTDINPYLALAGCLASGLYGIQNHLPLTGSSSSTTEMDSIQSKNLPKNLYEAATRMGNSQIAKELFGSEFVEYFVATRLWEWDQFQKTVTNWELERYFNVV